MSKPESKTTFALLIVLLVLCGCKEEYPPMTNDQIIAETKKCEDAGFVAVTLGRPFTDGGDTIRRIQCQRKQ